MRSTKDMLLKIFRYGKGNGDSAISYLLSEYTSAKKKRIPQPEVLYGNPDLIKMCIKNIPYKWKYTSGVLSFAPEDAPTQDELNAVIDTFEKMAFP